MDRKFQAHLDALPAKLRLLLAMQPLEPGRMPQGAPRADTAGIYVFSERGRHLYVGRSNDIRGRVQRHSRPKATHRMAAFAFRLAREETDNIRASYGRVNVATRAQLMDQPAFRSAFVAAKARIRAMDLRFVEESDPVRQALLELYVAVALDCPYNDFDTH